MELRIEPGPHGVSIVRGAKGAGLLDLDRESVRCRFEESGALWFRGFETRAADFLEFIQQFSSELITFNSYERIRHREVHDIQSVTTGLGEMNLHTEMGHIPGRPDFLSFWCEVPPQAGGETVIVDGVALWNALSEPTRRLFQTKRVRYLSVIPKEWWTHQLRSERREDVERAVAGIPDFEFDIEEDGTLILIWRTFAAFRPNFGGAMCLASSLFPYVVPGLGVRFEDGDEIPEDVADELAATAESRAAEIQWSAQDVLLFDNTRWLHGRRAVGGDGRRSIQMLQGYLTFAPEHRVRLKRADA